MTEHCPDCGSDECAALFWPNDLGATIGCLMRQLAATKAENEQLRSGELIRKTVAEVVRVRDAYNELSAAHFELLGQHAALRERIYRLHDGNSESVTGTLTVGEGGILLARDRWESSDLEAAAALEPGQKVQLSEDGFWIERVE